MKKILRFVPPDWVKVFYTVMFREKNIRLLPHRLITVLLPDFIVIGESRIYLNPRDAVVSGSLFLGCYERENISFLMHHLEPQMRFIDVGANLGLYSVLASKKVGMEGEVVSIEPEPGAFPFGW